MRICILGVKKDGSLASGGLTFAAADNLTGNILDMTLKNDEGSLSLKTLADGDIIIDSDDTLLLDADGVLELNSSAGAISIGNDDVDENINIGTDGVRTITIGNDSTKVDVDALAIELDSAGSVVTDSATTASNTSGTTATLSSGGVLAIDTVGTDATNLGTEAAAETITCW